MRDPHIAIGAFMNSIARKKGGSWASLNCKPEWCADGSPPWSATILSNGGIVLGKGKGVSLDAALQSLVKDIESREAA